jgi:hypothetical protein
VSGEEAETAAMLVRSYVGMECEGRDSRHDSSSNENEVIIYTYVYTHIYMYTLNANEAILDTTRRRMKMK